jgi:hypothetical protein
LRCLWRKCGKPLAAWRKTRSEAKRSFPPFRIGGQERIQWKRLSSARVRFWWVAAGEGDTPGRRMFSSGPKRNSSHICAKAFELRRKL